MLNAFLVCCRLIVGALSAFFGHDVLTHAQIICILDDLLRMLLLCYLVRTRFMVHHDEDDDEEDDEEEEDDDDDDDDDMHYPMMLSFGYPQSENPFAPLHP